MHDLEKIVVACAKWEGIVRAVNDVNRGMPLELRKRLNAVFSSYLARYGLKGVFDRLNNRSVAQIFAEYDAQDPPVMAEGEVDGVKYRLFDASPPGGGEDERQSKEKT